jgi:hypothetical protein
MPANYGKGTEPNFPVSGASFLSDERMFHHDV